MHSLPVKISTPDRLAELLEITEESFSQLQQLLSLKDRLNEVKETFPEVSYNQIRFVLACMIRDVVIHVK